MAFMYDEAGRSLRRAGDTGEHQTVLAVRGIGLKPPVICSASKQVLEKRRGYENDDDQKQQAE